MQALQFVINKNTKAENVFYTINWSPLMKADKYKISTGTPSVSGLYEVYSMDKMNQLNLFKIAIAWYGGVRSNVREAIDPYAKSNYELRKFLEDADLYFRFSCSECYADLQDVLWFMNLTYFPNDEPPEDSGRYENIYLEENSPDNFIWNGNPQENE